MSSATLQPNESTETQPPTSAEVSPPTTQKSGDGATQADTIPLGDWDWLLGLEPAHAIILSSTVAIIIALFSMSTQKKISRQKETIDSIIRIQMEPEYITVTQTFMRLRAEESMIDILHSEKRRDTEDRYALIVFLNHYELLCIAMRKGVIDEKLFCLYHRGVLIHHWHDAREYIKAARIKTENEKAYNHFETFATYWENDKYVTTRIGRPSKQKVPKPLPAPLQTAQAKKQPDIQNNSGTKDTEGSKTSP